MVKHSALPLIWTIEQVAYDLASRKVSFFLPRRVLLATRVLHDFYGFVFSVCDGLEGSHLAQRPVQHDGYGRIHL